MTFPRMDLPAATVIRSAFVLGSTSEVAQAICHALAKRGCRRFHLVARNDESNQRLARSLAEDYGAAVSTELTNLLSDAALDVPQIGRAHV